jgi:sugar phosphate isomerase/epimerase
VQGSPSLEKVVLRTKKNWVMEDSDLLGNKTMTVDFDFKHQTDVLLKGISPQNDLLWTTRYIKQNPKEKNIGVQLVSVKEEMEENPERTLKYLSRFGYSFIETFVYKERSFYGYSSKEFKHLVEKNDMKFTGSMTFYNLPQKESDQIETMKWWSNCIDDHIAAGVEYLTISNTQLNEINSLEELKRYCEYYENIGKLCREKGILVAYHNHADEFMEIAGVRIYDYMLANTNPDYVNFQADLYCMHVAGVDPISYFQEHKNRFLSWHVNDYSELVESGKMNLESYFKFAQTAGLKFTVAEVEAFNYPVWHSLDRAWNYLYFKIL